MLRAKERKGYSFLRQRPVLNYIADFMCMELMLILEIDGSALDSVEAKQRDEIRQKNLEAIGFTVVRFRNKHVLFEMQFVQNEIDKWIETKEKQLFHQFS